METKHVAVVGAGIVGLSTAISLQQAGFTVTLIDRNDPGKGASFGNAGLFADYARLPFTKFAMLRKMPGMLLDSESPLSMQGAYLPHLMPYGWGFLKSCSQAKYEQGRAALTQLQHHTRENDDHLLALTGARSLVQANGCLGLFATQENFVAAQEGDMAERLAQGVNLSYVGAEEVAELEPDLAPFYAGGVFYKDTRFTVNPLALCRRYAEYFAAQGGRLLNQEVVAVHPSIDRVEVQLQDQRIAVEHVVMCAGVASQKLLDPLGCRFPLVSERGYHLTLDTEKSQISRPVGWLDKAIFLTPMATGVRLAGTAEFAFADAPANEQRTDVMLNHAQVMLGFTPQVQDSWVGSRPSTPDSLPVIGSLKAHPRIIAAFGHGHLGLTFAAVTGKLVTQTIQGVATAVDLQPFAPERFS
ncbi:NAD(P)/FAD-dependent oxidoreductase [Neptunomonas marina]|uniref:FAD-binding oxidoreductase n=1 Tax=Neptunomonas marina TaxID=1815562 RepID=A0A437Q4M1_9GAMM|nr:FAD-dependent oxidoreductase [Neptunomonas marina]RVU29460.1 FAD-binding oxidoreductase [Neptunomonas marina]